MIVKFVKPDVHGSPVVVCLPLASASSDTLAEASKENTIFILHKSRQSFINLLTHD